jgi:hypothetical protein
MTLRTMPDAERLVSTFWRAQAEVAALVGDRVYTTLPATKTWPLVRLQRVGGSTTPVPGSEDSLLWDVPLLQVEAYGGPKAVAWQLADVLRATAQQRLAAVHATGWCEQVVLGTTRYLPDPDFEPARPRVVFDLTLYLRPAGDNPSP